MSLSPTPRGTGRRFLAAALCSELKPQGFKNYLTDVGNQCAELLFGASDQFALVRDPTLQQKLAAMIPCQFIGLVACWLKAERAGDLFKAAAKLVATSDPQQLAAAIGTSAECLSIGLALGWSVHVYTGFALWSAGGHRDEANVGKALAHEVCAVTVIRRGLQMHTRGSARWVAMCAASNYFGFFNSLHYSYGAPGVDTYLDMADVDGARRFIAEYDHAVHSKLAESSFSGVDYSFFCLPGLNNLVARHGDLLHPCVFAQKITAVYAENEVTTNAALAQSICCTLSDAATW